MNGYRGLGTKSLKICNAVPRPWNKITGTTSQLSGDYSSTNIGSDNYNYYDTSSYWNSYSAWQQGYYGSEPTSDNNYGSYASEHKHDEDDLELIGKLLFIYCVFIFIVILIFIYIFRTLKSS